MEKHAVARGLRPRLARRADRRDPTAASSSSRATGASSRWSIRERRDAPLRLYTAGAPNACVLGGDGALYVCQNGGTVGPWRAAEMTTPSIQRVHEGGTAETLVTEIAGIALNGPNDLVFHADGRLIFTDPGTYNPDDPNPSYIFAIAPDGSTSLLARLSRTRLPQRGRRRGRRLDCLGRILHRPCRPPAARRHHGRPRPHAGRQPYPGRHDRRRRRPPLRDRPRPPAACTCLKPDGTVDGFLDCGGAPTNCVFDGETMWVTDAGASSPSAMSPTTNGQLWRLRVPGGGAPTQRGTIRMGSPQ